MPRKYFILCLVFSLWTIIQTSFHLVFVIFAYYLGICETSPSDENEIFFYLTYLYNTGCSRPQWKSSSLANSTSPQSYFFKMIRSAYSQRSNAVTLEEVIVGLLPKLDYFPSNAEVSSRTLVFLLCFIILDGTWIVSAVSLAMGTTFGIKGSMSLVFYGPWLVMTICVAIFDATASVFFGFDIAATTSFSDWLIFVGITDASPFQDLLSMNIPGSVTTSPSIALCVVSARFALIWLSNWIGFIFVIRATISVFHEPFKNEVPRPRTFVDSPVERNRTDHDTSAARIRNWQLFYGAVDATSTHSSKSVESEKDLSSKEEQNDANESNYYFAYPDVADSVVLEGAGCLEELRGQLPWSYTQPLERRGSGEEKIELETRKQFKVTLDSSNSGTEL